MKKVTLLGCKQNRCALLLPEIEQKLKLLSIT